MSIFSKLDDLDMDIKIHLMTVIQEESKELTRNQVKTILKQDAILGKSMHPEHNALEKLIRDNKEKIKMQNALNNKTLYSFITISFKPDAKINQIKKFNSKFITKACFTKCLGVIEQRGTPEKNNVGTGLHCHYLVERNLKYKPTKMRVHVKDACKNLVGSIDNPNFVNFKVLSTEFAKDKQEYIIGTKYGEDKDKKQEGDNIYRSKNDIKEYYGEIIF